MKRYIMLILSVLALAACSTAAPAGGATIQISDPWARPAVMDDGAMSGMEEPAAESESGEGMGHSDMDMSGATSAAYMVIRNTGSAADKLVAASGDIAKSIEIHTVIEENGMMQMRPVEGGIEIPAGGSVELKPGGYHVMLIGLNRDMIAGETVQLTLKFEQAGDVPVTATIRAP